MSKPKPIIFTDLDGTLLTHDTYSFEPAREAIESLRLHEIPLIFCSAKTRMEQEVYREALGIQDPFVVENGGAVFIKNDYFPFNFKYHRVVGPYKVIEFGKPYRFVTNSLLRVAQELGIELKRYGNMTSEEVAEYTGLDHDAARRAKHREYEETVITSLDQGERRMLEARLKNYGLRLTDAARFSGVGQITSDKGRAVEVLADMYRRKYGDIQIYGLGDSHNDAPMLAAVDLPFLVEKQSGDWEQIDIPKIGRIEGIGPVGWARAVEKLLSGELSVLSNRLDSGHVIL
ncbi:MAG: mannosyl-3-phosphoglycerate phosphatase [Desulfobacterales bacterium]